MRRFLKVAAATIGVLAASVIVAALWSPWPSVLVVRAIFDSGAAATSEKLKRHAPPGVSVQRDLVYDRSDPDARFDIIRPPPDVTPAATVVWIHGGGFISGRRSDIENYLKVLAGRGFTVVNLDYSIAPEARYPTPVRQVNAALGFVSREGGRLGLNPDRLILAGDSAGAQIAAQVALLHADPDYAARTGIIPAIRRKQIVGAVLFCGPYDLDLMGDGWFTRTTTWAYSGRRDHRGDADFQLMSVVKHVTANFPPSFISAGNGDPLLPHSLALVEALRGQGVTVDTLFLPDHDPPLGHEYQFDLDTDAGRLALERSVAFARRVAAVSAPDGLS